MASCEHCGTEFSAKIGGRPVLLPGLRVCGGVDFRAGIRAVLRSETRASRWLRCAAGRSRSTIFPGWGQRWRRRSARREAHHEPARLDLGLEGISCVGCVWLVEKLFARHPGSIRAAANPSSGRLHLEWVPGKCELEPFLRELCQFGYVAAPAGAAGGDHERRRLAARLGLCAAFALNTMGFSLPIYLGMPADFEFAALVQADRVSIRHAVDAGGRRVFHGPRVAGGAGGLAAHRSADRAGIDLGLSRIDRRLGAGQRAADVFRFRLDLRVPDAGRPVSADHGGGAEPAALGPPATGAGGRATRG